MKPGIKKRLSLPDGGAVLLYDMDNVSESLPACDVDRNICRVNNDDKMMWQIAVQPGVRPRTPFTNIYFDSDGQLRAFRFDCYEYRVDIETGKADVTDFLK